MLQLSVVLPTYNRKAQLMKVIEGLEKQTFAKEKFEVVVVSDGSTDDTNDYLSHLSTPLNLKPVFQENQGVAATRNRGVESASAPLILFIDDDVVPHPDLLKQHIETHEQAGKPTKMIVIGPMLNPPNFAYKPWVEWEQRMLYKQYDAMDRGDWAPTARQFYTGNCSLHREYFKQFGGFNASFKRAEDVELAYRMADDGAMFIYNNQAIGYHYASRSYESWKNTPYAYGRNDVIFNNNHGQSWLVPTIMKEYGGRNALIRFVNRLCLDRSNLSQFVQTLFFTLAQLAYRLGLKSFYIAGFSLIFNIRHYQGMSDELGGRQKFFQLLGTAQN